MIAAMPDTEPGADAAALGGLRVLHVVEKYRSGVGSAIAQYTHHGEPERPPTRDSPRSDPRPHLLLFLPGVPR